MATWAWILALGLSFCSAGPPPNHARAQTSWDWCDCGTGVKAVSVWPVGNESQRVVVGMNSSAWARFSPPVDKVAWQCDGMNAPATSSSLGPKQEYWSMRLTTDTKTFPCGRASGRLRWNTWTPTAYNTSVPFSSFDEGYACMKIPVLLSTHNGTLLAFAEARTPDCGDFSRTDLIVKRSTDGGRTWSSSRRLVDPARLEGLCGNPPTVGNAAPVQLAPHDPHHPDRILVPHTHNNYEVWVVQSDDDGISWSAPRHIPNVVNTTGAPDCTRNMSYFGVTVKDPKSIIEWIKDLGWGTFDPYVKWRAQLRGPWQFIGLGPPGSIQLDSGRVLVPAYHSYIRGLGGGSGAGAGVALPISQLYNNLALGHLMISENGGDTWTLGSPRGFGDGLGKGANEDQFVQLRNGSVLVSSRSFSTGSPQFRLQARSDDGGLNFGPTRFVEELPEPFNGCQGSIAADVRDSTLYFAHPNPVPNHSIAPDILALLGASANLTGRDHMTVWQSLDSGATYSPWQLIDAGAAGYSSLQAGPPGSRSLWLLYEQSDEAAQDLSTLGLEALIGHLTVLNPDRLVLRELLLPQ